MICANTAALARYERDCSQADHDYKIAFGEGLQEAFAQKEQFEEIVNLSTQLSLKIREIQKSSGIWDCLMDGATNYDLENINVVREWASWLEKYGEKYAEING